MISSKKISKNQISIDHKIDKITTAGFERVYTINADGSQGTKATSELGVKFTYKNITAYTHTGTTAATLLFQTTIPANAISNGDLIEFIVNAYRVSGASANIIPRIYASNTNNFATATQIATTAIATGGLFNRIRREAECYGGNLKFVLAGTNQTNVDYSTFTSPTDYPIDFTQPIYVFFAMVNQSATDVSKIQGAYIFVR